MHKIWAAKYRKTTANPADLLDTLDEVRFYGLDHIKPADVPDSWIKNTIATAEKLLQHRCKVFALEDVYWGERINWNHEYKRNIDTPLIFGPWMNYRDTESYGDFKYFWELPRLQHLITLAKAYYLTNNEKYANAVVEQLNDFVEQCPYLLGVNWIMPMEAAIRLISISWVAAFLKGYLRQDIRACSIIARIVSSHVDYVAKSFSAYSSANNHLIGEAAGVFVASICFGQIDGMDKHKRNTYDILCREITRQFYPDGTNKEQTTHYHISCYNCFLLAALMGKNNGLDFPPEYWRTLESAADFIYALTNSDSSIPHIGDSDSSKIIVLSETGRNAVQALLATAAVLFKRSNFKTKVRRFDEMSLWLLGKTGKATFDALGAASKAAAFEKFEEGGYYILRSDGPANPKVVFVCGPLGFGSIAGHGHADSLSFMLYAHEREFLIDPGTYIFEAENPYRNYFRSTAAHNTITVDGMDQSEMTGPFLWSHKASSFIEEGIDTEKHARVTGWHDGYQRLRDPVIHRRTIELDKKRSVISIRDSIEAKSAHEICQYFHLAPECEATQKGQNHWIINNRGKTIELIADDMFECEVVRGNEEPICGWASKSYDNKVQINTLIGRSISRGSQCFSTKIVL